METIGQYLQQQRVARNLSLASAAAHTRIQTRFLEAIENDRWDHIPHSVSAKGFIRSYAQFLQLNPVETLQRFSLLEPPGVEKALAVENVALRDMGRIGPSSRIPLDLFQKAPLKAVGVLALLIGFLLWLSPKNRVVSSPVLSSETGTPQERLVVSESAPPENTTETELPASTPIAFHEQTSSAPEEPLPLEPLVVPPAPGPTPPVSVDVPRLFPTASSVEHRSSSSGERRTSASAQNVHTGTPPSGSPIEKPISKNLHSLVLSLEASATTWVKLLIDNRTTQEALLQPGDKVHWKAEEKFLMTLGNAGGVRVAFNGQDLGVLGNPNEVIRDRLFTAAMTPAIPSQKEKPPLEPSLLEKEPL